MILFLHAVILLQVISQNLFGGWPIGWLADYISKPDDEGGFYSWWRRFLWRICLEYPKRIHHPNLSLHQKSLLRVLQIHTWILAIWWMDPQELENCYLGREVGSEKVAWLPSDDPRQEVQLGTDGWWFETRLSSMLALPCRAGNFVLLVEEGSKWEKPRKNRSFRGGGFKRVFFTLIVGGEMIKLWRKITEFS